MRLTTNLKKHIWKIVAVIAAVVLAASVPFESEVALDQNIPRATSPP